MQLATQQIAKYIGGQAEIQNQCEDYICRGEIAKIEVVSGELRIQFAWIGRSTFPPVVWRKSEGLDYSANLLDCDLIRIDNGRTLIQVPCAHQLLVLFMPGTSKFNPSRFET